MRVIIPLVHGRLLVSKTTDAQTYGLATYLIQYSYPYMQAFWLPSIEEWTLQESNNSHSS